MFHLVLSSIESFRQQNRIFDHSSLVLFLIGRFHAPEVEGNAKATLSDLSSDEALARAAKVPHHSIIAFEANWITPRIRIFRMRISLPRRIKVILPVMQWITVDAVIELRGSPITEYPILTGHVSFILCQGRQ